MCMPAQCFRKVVASAQDVICEQYLRPSHLKPGGAAAREAPIGKEAFAWDNLAPTQD